MASKDAEDVHTILLNKLISDSGLECIRSAQESLESSSLTGESEEMGIYEEEEEEIAVEVQPEEEKKVQPKDESVEELPDVFPTPSLRRVLPDRVRKIEEHNRIHVLPEEFNTYIDPLAIPKIAQTAPQKYIDILAEIVGCTEYKTSLAEYWFLDTLANLLRRAQEDELCRGTQAVLINWFCEWMKEMQHFDAADRQRMLRRFKENMLAAARFIGEEESLPTPQEAGVYYKAPDDDIVNPLSNIGMPTGSKSLANTKSVVNSLTTSKSAANSLLPAKTVAMSKSTGNVDPIPMKAATMSKSVAMSKSLSPGMESKYFVDFETTGYECSLMDLTKIIHYIFDLFSTDYQYNLVRSIFTFTPENVLIDAPCPIQFPRRMYASLKPTKPLKKEKSPKLGAKAKKGKAAVPDTEEYLALLELKARDYRELDEQEERDRQQLSRRTHILPLSFAATEEFFNKYWPPPPEPEAEPATEPEPKKGKPKGKK